MCKKIKLHVLIISFCVALFLSFSLLLGFNYVKGLEVKPNKCYITIKVKSNDSLWSIAKENMNTKYYKINTYIKEVKQINNLYTDKILEGDYIIIPIIN
jgi:cell division protein YceG involved in septum cleavage